MYVQSSGIVVDDITGNMYEFLANLGVKQGDGTSCKLFTIFFDQVYPFLKQYYTTHNIDSTKRYAYTIASL
jgi:hypothetical protein